MTKINDCKYENRVKGHVLDHIPDAELELHIPGCSECRETARVLGWMYSFAGQTAMPGNLPSPGLLLFKARLAEKQAAARMAVRPITWMNTGAVIVLVLTLFYFQSRGGASAIFISEGLRSFVPIAPLAVAAVIGAGLICLVAARLFRDTNAGCKGPLK